MDFRELWAIIQEQRTATKSGDQADRILSRKLFQVKDILRYDLGKKRIMNLRQEVIGITKFASGAFYRI